MDKIPNNQTILLFLLFALTQFIELHRHKLDGHGKLKLRTTTTRT